MIVAEPLTMVGNLGSIRDNTYLQLEIEVLRVEHAWMVPYLDRRATRMICSSSLPERK